MLRRHALAGLLTTVALITTLTGCAQKPAIEYPQLTASDRQRIGDSLARALIYLDYHTDRPTLVADLRSATDSPEAFERTMSKSALANFRRFDPSDPHASSDITTIEVRRISQSKTTGLIHVDLYLELGSAGEEVLTYDLGIENDPRTIESLNVPHFG